jgi:uncharacterized protein YacL
MIGFENVSDASVIALFAGAFLAAAFVLFVAYYDGFKKQKLDAALINAKKAKGEDLTVDEEVDLAKVGKFDLRYMIALGMGIIMTGAITVIITAAITLAFAIPDVWVYYGVIAFVVSVIVASLIDDKFLHKAANGAFRSDVLTPMVKAIEDEAMKAGKPQEMDTSSVIDAIIAALNERKGRN